ncbi:MAG TPA: ABC transporter substrate-binding protein, partial [Thermomicrobiales bacterium]|nr:ABC transporter substrate-binding protein [Thermomicrobiales bacterium]
MKPLLSRRALLQATTSAGVVLSLTSLTSRAQATPTIAELVIDLASEPASLAPSLGYEVNAWSVTQSVFDALWEYDDDGNLVMVGAESLTWVDPLTLAIKLRPDQLFHDGTPVTSASIVASWQQAIATETGSSIAGNFGTITSIDTPDDLTATITLVAPSPWLPAQIAVWMLLIDPASADAVATSAKPNGSGPYIFQEWVSGDHISLVANPAYDNPGKGSPIAQKVTFRFVSEGATRVADLQSGTAQIVRTVPVDSIQAVRDSGQTVIEHPVSGVAFVRIATDTAPFNDVRVRRALNYAVDVDAIRNALLDGTGQRLPNLFVPGGLGFDAALAPYTYDPEQAKSLLADAGVSKLETSLAVTNSERKDVVEAIAGYLGDVGIKVTVDVQEVATFNAGWSDPTAAPLRFASWRPMFDPFNLLFLVFSKGGYL